MSTTSGVKPMSSQPWRRKSECGGQEVSALGEVSKRHQKTVNAKETEDETVMLFGDSTFSDQRAQQPSMLVVSRHVVQINKRREQVRL